MGFKISLAAARVNAGMTQQDDADKLRVNRCTVNAWETGKTKPGPLVMMALSKIYDIPMDFLRVPEK